MGFLASVPLLWDDRSRSKRLFSSGTVKLAATSYRAFVGGSSYQDYHCGGVVCQSQSVNFTKDTIPDSLGWLLSVIELVIVLAIALLVGYVLFCFLAGTGQADRLTNLMHTVNENWKAALILLIPLFYRPVRMFLENLEEAGSFKRRKTVPATAKEQETNPPKTEHT